MALHVDCHGQASYLHQELGNVTRQFAAFMVLHACIGAPIFARHITSNLMTGEENSVPNGA